MMATTTRVRQCERPAEHAVYSSIAIHQFYCILFLSARIKVAPATTLAAAREQPPPRNQMQIHSRSSVHREHLHVIDATIRALGGWAENGPSSDWTVHAGEPHVCTPTCRTWKRDVLTYVGVMVLVLNCERGMCRRGYRNAPRSPRAGVPVEVAQGVGIQEVATDCREQKPGA